MKNKKLAIQTTLFEDDVLQEYLGLNADGKIIRIPNFQPLGFDDNPRLDLENDKTKRKNQKRRNTKWEMN